MEGSELQAFFQQEDLLGQSKMAKRKVNFTMSSVKKSKCITEEIELSKTCEEKKSETEHDPGESQVEAHKKFVSRRSCALAIIVLAVEPSLLYLIGDPEDPVTVWNKLEGQFQKKTWANKLELRRSSIFCD